MLTASFTSPHEPYVAEPEFWDLYADDEIDLPEVGAIAPEAMDAHSRRMFEHYSVGEAVVIEDILRRMRYGYYASISYIDSEPASGRSKSKETPISASRRQGLYGRPQRWNDCDGLRHSTTIRRSRQGDVRAGRLSAFAGLSDHR